MTEEARYTYRLGSRPEGVTVYDEGTSLCSWHDSDPARGSNNSFDLVRLHRFGHLDTDADQALPVTERPSFKAMVELAMADPKVQAELAAGEFSDLGEAPPAEAEFGALDPAEGAAPANAPQEASAEPLAKHIGVLWRSPTQTRWLLRDELEHGVMALMAGRRGSFKSFKALHWACRVALTRRPVYVVSAEGGDFGRRAEAWALHHDVDDAADKTEFPLYVVERRIDLSTTAGVEAVRRDCVRLGIRPVLFVLDTFSKLSGGLDENDNSAVKAFLGRLDNGLKRPAPQAFDATVLLVAHTGHSDNGRARGASALEADTDACYIVSRDDVTGTVAITRERFKSSPELPPLTYKPTIIPLGREDEDGVPVTSIVLEPMEPVAVAERRAKARLPGGKNQKHVLRVLKRMAPDGSTVPVVALLDEAVRQLPLDSTTGRDLRRQNCRKALEALTSDQLAFLHGEHDVSLTPARIEDPEEWLK